MESDDNSREPTFGAIAGVSVAAAALMGLWIAFASGGLRWWPPPTYTVTVRTAQGEVEYRGVTEIKSDVFGAYRFVDGDGTFVQLSADADAVIIKREK